MNKILILSDIHNQIERADRIIEAEKADVNICAGDFFDDFNDTPREAGKTALWIRNRLDKPNFIFLHGNHDIPYLYPSIYTDCPGYTTGKQMAVDVHLNFSAFFKFKWFYWLNENTLISHAGITNYWLKHFGVHRSEIRSWLDSCALEANKSISDEKDHWFLTMGKSRGGTALFGGLVWCDWTTEFSPIYNLNQIVGHTPGAHIRYHNIPQGLNCCIDTGLDYYLISDGKNITEKAYKNL